MHLTVDENEKNKALENPGGKQWQTYLGGAKAGLPFIAVVDYAGLPLINSNADQEKQTGNTGHPAKPEEIAHFMKMLRATAPKLTDAERTTIETWLTKHGGN